MASLAQHLSHIRHHKGGCHGKDRTALLQTNPSTGQLRCARGLGKAEEGIAPWKRVGKQFGGCDRAIPNPNLLIKSFAHRIKYLLKSIVLLYSPGSYANTLEAGPRAERWLQAYIPTNS